MIVGFLIVLLSGGAMVTIEKNREVARVEKCQSLVAKKIFHKSEFKMCLEIEKYKDETL